MGGGKGITLQRGWWIVDDVTAYLLDVPARYEEWGRGQRDGWCCFSLSTLTLLAESAEALVVVARWGEWGVLGALQCDAAGACLRNTHFTYFLHI